MKTILLKLAGPLQSYGTKSHFETRETDYYPSKSAIIGLIAASLGYRRNDDENIQKLNSLSFGVRVDQPGTLMRDYHTASKYKVTSKQIVELDRTYVTNRYYLEDAVFTVAIGSEDDEYIEKIYSNLQKPYFQTYMGRRSLPLPYDYLIEINRLDVIGNLKTTPWNASGWYKKHAPNTLDIYCDSDLIKGSHSYRKRKDIVKSFSQKNRQFKYRYESNLTVPIDNIEKVKTHRDHDIFEELGG